MSIAVYGDIIVDEYIYGTSSRLSPEAPVPVVDFVKSEIKLGGAANVFNNIKSLTRSVSMLTSTDTPPIKKRVFSDGHYITRIDHTPQNIVWKHVDQYADVIVFSDYNKGAWEQFKELEISSDSKLIIDPKRPLIDYGQSFCIKPNRKEFEDFVGQSVTLNNIESLMVRVMNIIDTEHLIVTLGQDGVAYYNLQTGFMHIPTCAVEVSDVTGAGDTFTATLAYAIHCNYTMLDAIQLANVAAGIAVKHHGTYVIKPEDLFLKRETVVFTNGCFDILHPGHIKLLKDARKLGTKLVVGLNSDHSVARLKGPDRPVNSVNQRAEMLGSLGFIDEIYVFDEDTPYELIKTIKPDIIVKGGDYTTETVVGNDLAKVVIIPTKGTYSTTNMIKRIRNAT